MGLALSGNCVTKHRELFRATIKKKIIMYIFFSTNCEVNLSDSIPVVISTTAERNKFVNNSPVSKPAIILGTSALCCLIMLTKSQSLNSCAFINGLRTG